jgi:predicted amidohydrolase YtcJ
MKRTQDMLVLSLALLVGMLGLAGGELQAQGAPPELVVYPNLIVHNAKIVTMDDYGINTNPGNIYEAVAVRDGQIWRLGTTDEILRFAGPDTTRIDAGRRTVIPGLINAHSHVHDHALGRYLQANPDHPGVRAFRVMGDTPEEIDRNLHVLLTERMSSVKPGQWSIINLQNAQFGTGDGPGFHFLNGTMTTAQKLDEYTGSEKPIIVAAHPAYIINTAAMEALEKMYNGKIAPFPEGWTETGFADMGIEFRRQIVVDGYYNDKTDKLAEIIHYGLLEEAAAGITTFSSHLMGIQNLNAYMRLYRDERMPVRFGFTHYTGLAVTQHFENFVRRLGDLYKLGDDHFWFAAIGLGMIDHGPPLFCSSIVPEDERGKPGEGGLEWCRYSKDAWNYQAVVTYLAQGGRVVAGHNYGDLSADFFMDAIEEAMAKNPNKVTLDHIRSLRLSMDHGGLYPRPDQLPRLKNLGMMLAMDTGSMSRSLPWIQKYGFEKYQGWVVPVKRTLDSGIKVAWEGEGSWRNGAFSLMTGFMTRKNKQGVIVGADQALDRVSVLKMATAWGSEYMIKEDKLGSLEVGKLADFLVLNQDYFTIPIEQIDKTYPLMTVVGGQVRYLRDEFASEVGEAPVGAQLRYSFEEGGNHSPLTTLRHLH